VRPNNSLILLPQPPRQIPALVSLNGRRQPMDGRGPGVRSTIEIGCYGDAGWGFYFRRSNYCSCNEYTGGEDVEGGLTEDDFLDLAKIPGTQPPLAPCTVKV
jgi:hypothetical protein